MSQHTISSALRRIKGVAGEIATCDQRLARSVVHKKDDAPTWSFEELRVKRKALVKEMIEMKAGVAIANATAKLPDGTPLIVAVHKLTQLKGTISFLEGLSVRNKGEFMHVEIERDYEVTPMTVVRVETPMICAYTERAQAEELEKLRADFAEINRQVESANHTTRLPE